MYILMDVMDSMYKYTNEVIGERAKRARLFRCTECKFAMYVYIYVYLEVCVSPVFVAWGRHPIHKGGGVRPQPFF